MKKIARILPLCFAALTGSVSATESHKFYLSGPITGDQAGNGEIMRLGFELAIQHFNAKGGIRGIKVLPVIHDDVCSPRQAVSVANTITSEPGDVKLVFGPFCSSSTIPAKDRYREAGNVVQLTVSQAATITAGQSNQPPTLFRINVDNAGIGKALAEAMLADKKNEPVFILHEKSLFGVDIANTVQPILNEANIKSTAEGFDPHDKDFSAVALKIVASGIGKVLIAGNADKIGILIRALRAQGYKGSFFTPGTGTLPDVPTMAGCTNIYGTIAVTVKVNRDQLKKIPEITQAFNKQGVAQPFDLHLMGYAAAQIFTQVLESVDNPNDARQVLARVRQGSFDTVIGKMDWDDRGNWKNADVAYYKWKCTNGQATAHPLASPF